MLKRSLANRTAKSTCPGPERTHPTLGHSRCDSPDSRGSLPAADRHISELQDPEAALAALLTSTHLFSFTTSCLVTMLPLSPLAVLTASQALALVALPAPQYTVDLNKNKPRYFDVQVSRLGFRESVRAWHSYWIFWLRLTEVDEETLLRTPFRALHGTFSLSGPYPHGSLRHTKGSD